MPEYRNADGQQITEDEALALPQFQTFSITWEDGRSVECIANSDGSWTVGHRSSGEFKYYGAVRREDGLYRPADIVYMKPQETFSAAARKYL
ncbi:hypothetical protein HF576_01340 [Microbacterium sp. CFH 90308]|uniref:Uncharacterized protein n=1 Tax=Microbacterium salsuginis TaxID=2722803 RepID=A0ABX1K683_9MICO|nr:hypothetical protein [Microbacterium sp. CFH 90308]NLP82482.1 hypothetical protein [Microbacterium sp. CFH 90308]